MSLSLSLHTSTHCSHDAARRGGGRWERLARAGEGEGGYAFEGHGWPMTMTAKGEEGTWADDQACGRLLWRVLVLPCGCTAPHRTAPHHTTTAAAAY